MSAPSSVASIRAFMARIIAYTNDFPVVSSHSTVASIGNFIARVLAYTNNDSDFSHLLEMVRNTLKEVDNGDHQPICDAVMVTQLQKIAGDIKVLTSPYFWCLNNSIHDFRNHEDSEESRKQYQLIADLIKNDPSDGIGEFVETSIGLTELTIFSPSYSNRLIFSTEIHRENSGIKITYAEVLEMIVALPHGIGKVNYVDEIFIDEKGRMVITMTD